ncbi:MULTISPECIES: STAS domain-containing protein [Mycolicibacterium]|uniref:Anti-sigma factor antagonist n=2 Tax=Mycolicibacterium TaxID=1866885 RepID=A0A378TRG2_9MYCO|nr:MULTISPECIES: STAS domain-containing protein [Mycolicibacterium]MCV7182602.1 STAS domain-containing protein [Mycolicibacterium murale]BBY89159.1 anti-sigma factor antagonist [Mycolicibacterium tokaiense]GFG59508.1 anti-sigma factor antagonist [Mycolicibacterium murale]STZ62453.1 anti-sigma-factor antagonist [Mycolicibacterium tokaiense]
MSEQPKLVSESTSPVTCVIGEEWVGRVAVLSVSGVVDMLTAPQLEEAITTSLGKTPAALVVDLTDVEFLASAGMGVLVGAHDQLPEGVKFGVVADGPVTSRPLKLVGIADIVDLFQTRDEALAKLDA